MKRIVVHIGTHKTATTTIQRNLAARRDYLRQQRVLYATTDRPPHPNKGKHLNLFRALREGGAALLKERDILLNEFAASDCDTLLLSEEHLSWLSSDKLAQMECFARSHCVEVVCFLRRQDFFLESMWSQRVKGGEEQNDIATYFSKGRVRERMKYDRILDVWRRFASVRAVSFEDAKRQGVISTFCQAAGIHEVPETLKKNVTPSANCTMILLAMNRLGHRHGRQQIIRAFQDDHSKGVLGRNLRHEVLTEMAESNQRLERYYGVRFDKDLPSEPDEPLTEPDRVSIQQALQRLSPDKEVDLDALRVLQEAALSFAPLP